MIRYALEPTDYQPDETALFFAYRGEELLYRRLIERKDEALHRAEVEQRYNSSASR